MVTEILEYQLTVKKIPRWKYYFAELGIHLTSSKQNPLYF
jgi:hypothetical protein